MSDESDRGRGSENKGAVPGCPRTAPCEKTSRSLESVTPSAYAAEEVTPGRLLIGHHLLHCQHYLRNGMGRSRGRGRATGGLTRLWEVLRLTGQWVECRRGPGFAAGRGRADLRRHRQGCGRLRAADDRGPRPGRLRRAADGGGRDVDRQPRLGRAGGWPPAAG